MPRSIPLLVLLALLGACTAGDPTEEPAATTTPAEATPTSEPAAEEPAPTTTPTTTAPPVPSGPLLRGGLTPTVLVGLEIVINRTDGAESTTITPCARWEGTITSTALVVECPAVEDEGLVAVALDEGAVVTSDRAGGTIVGSGRDWIARCDSDECSLLAAATLTPIDAIRLPSPAPGDLTQGLEDLLHVSRDDRRWLYRISATAVEELRSGPAGDDWGDLVRLGDGRLAMAVGVDTGGDSRPEGLRYVDPLTGTDLGVADGAEFNTLFGVGPDVIRTSSGVNVQRANVRGFDPSGEERWRWPDDDSVAVGFGDQVWVYGPGESGAVQVDPLTGTETGFLTWPGPVQAGFGQVRMIDGWILAHVETPVGAEVVLMSY